MEGTLEDPLVKDPVHDDPTLLVKDKLIPNGVNGDLDDHVEDLEDSSVASDKEDVDRADEDKTEDEDETKEPDEDCDDVIECERRDDEEEEEADEGEEEELQEESEEAEEEVMAVAITEDEDLEPDDDYHEVSAEHETAILETEVCDEGDQMDSELTESADCVSAENNVCAVSSVVNDDECKVNAIESMELDARSDNSDVECLDVDPTLKNSQNVANENDDDMEIVTNEDPKDASITSGSSDVRQLNDSSVELVENSSETSPTKLCEENGSCESPDIEEITDGSKSNGHNNSQEQLPKDTPKKKSRKQIDLSGITPRRSSRNIKKTSYIEKEPEEEPEDNSSDIEEIKPEDPLACIIDASKDKENSKLKSPLKCNKTTIVVSDTKRLVEIAAGSKSSKGGKKEPTLVIIDTNSILSGRGGIPVSSSVASGGSGGSGNYAGKIASHQQHQQHQQHHHHQQQHHQQHQQHQQQQHQQQQHHHHQQQQQHHQQHQQLQQQQQHHHQQQQHHNSPLSSSSTFSVMPMGHTQTMFPNMRTTITPVPMSRTSQQSPKTINVPQQTPQLPQILPTLTDDMFVVEAPSFIVPYVYEKPPLKPLKDFVTKLEISIADCEREEKKNKLMEMEKKLEEEKMDVAETTIEKIVETGTNDDDRDIVDAKKNEIDTDVTVDLTEKIDNEKSTEEKIKTPTYFDLPLGKFFMQIGVNLVQEFVQTDLLRTQKRKQGRHGTASAETQLAINSLIKNLEFSKENNEPFHLEMKKCEFCNFKTESALVMQHHLETPHMKNYVYKCNFCPLEVRSPHDILFHMEAEHNSRGRLERGPAFHQCPNCPFEDNQKGKLTRHILACAKKFRPERNLEPATDWEPPAKIPRLNRPRQVGTVNASALAMAMGAKANQPLLPKLLPAPMTGRGRGRPPMQPRYSDVKSLRPGSGTTIRQADNVASMMYRPTSSGLLVPTPYQFGSNQIFQVVGGSGTVTSSVTGVSSGSSGSSGRPTPIALVPNAIDSQSRLSSSSSQNTSVASKSPAAKLLSQPSISITPLPRTTSQTPLSGSGSSSKPGGKNTFVICEICDGYIKDLEQLRNHMQWIHKVKIHPKMIYNRPPLNCQKCQFRFFTDQGLERHLLGSHGLVTSSMQEAANKGKDAGRCPACGRVYQWKLLNHVARDHGMTLKPAHLSYKCTVCTATFGMYKQFENHVYSAHSVVAKKVIDKKNAPSSPSSRSNDSLLKPLKINDEITIIPQPAKPTTRGSQGRGK